jgi:hypothetical protein
MRLFAKIGLSLALLVLGVAPGWAEEIAWAPANPQSKSAPKQASAPAPDSLLGDPEPLLDDPVAIPQDGAAPFAQPTPVAPTDENAEPASLFPFSDELGLRPQGIVFRGQAPDPVPNPFGGGGPGPGPAPVYGAPNDPLACGVPDSKKGNFWERFCEDMKNCGKNVFGPNNNIFQTSPNRKPFQSDPDFDMFTSPISNPFFLLDPRSLTEAKAIFIYQHTPGSNAAFAGGSNYYVGLQGSVAVTEWISVKISEFGVDFMEPNGNNPLISPNVGISEFHIGPQFTLIRNKETRTLLAAGLTFEIPWGSEKTFQHTGTLGVVPYVSFGQNFLKNKTGSVNFLNTTGWSFGSDRSDFFFSSFHFDYNVLNQDKIFPMIELNWAHYTNSGNQTPVHFEGWDLYNFGAHGVAGTDAVTLNFGARYQIKPFWSVGAAAGFSLVGGGNQLDNFRLTLDMIFRY